MDNIDKSISVTRVVIPFRKAETIVNTHLVCLVTIVGVLEEVKLFSFPSHSYEMIWERERNISSSNTSYIPMNRSHYAIIDGQ